MAVCKRCKTTVTWAEQRKQYGRLIRAGLELSQAKEAGPRCKKCMTVYLREEKNGTAARIKKS